MQTCDVCGNNEGKLFRCVQCLSRYYCSKDCSVKDWKNGHKEKCKRLAIDNETAVLKLRIHKEPVNHMQRRISQPRDTSFLKEINTEYDPQLIEKLDSWTLDDEDDFAYDTITTENIDQMITILFDKQLYNTNTQTNTVNIFIHFSKFSCSIDRSVFDILLPDLIRMYLSPSTEPELSNALDELFRSGLFDPKRVYELCKPYLDQKHCFEIKSAIAGILTRMLRTFSQDRNQIVPLLGIVLDSDHVTTESADTVGFVILKIIEIKGVELEQLVRRAFMINNVDVVYCGGYVNWCEKMDIEYSDTEELVQRYKQFDD